MTEANTNSHPEALTPIIDTFPIVAIGASSGGLEAVTELFKSLAPDTGMAYIFIQHLSADHKSILTELLAKTTKMKVQEIEDMELMKPNNVYVIPSTKGIEVMDGHIQLIPRAKTGAQLTIDVLFTSLAETHKEDAIGVVLSGNASDGTIGLRAIKQEGGITFAQDSSAKYDSMPQSAISEGVADFILSPKEIAKELGRISKHAFKDKKTLRPGRESAIDDALPELRSILQLLQKTTAVNFSGYKMSTIKRRILRRMLIYKIATLGQYYKLLNTNSNEVDILYNDLLINVTDFFRDVDTFHYLKNTLFPKIIKAKQPNEKLRVWVTACSTGQEAYSIAMLLVELLGDKLAKKQVQIFASDLSEQAIKRARAGIYSKNEIKAISTKRLTEFFVEKEGHFQINKSVRELCIFAPHNILGDPPFSHIDFVSCCNMLIYFDNDSQKKVFTTFHYALAPGGYLMLGKSETTGSSPYFTAISNKLKIYSRRAGLRTLPALDSKYPYTIINKNVPKPVIEVLDADAVISNILFSRFMPAYVVINQSFDIIRFKGATASYLQHHTGKASLNIISMARPEIAFELRNAISQVIETKLEASKHGIEMQDGDKWETIAISVIPIAPDDSNTLLLVVFSNESNSDADLTKKSHGISAKKGQTIKTLKAELAHVKAQMTALAEEKEKAYEVLQAINEEILTNNEEFQSMNEELDTSKEEVECANEELTTINQELQTRNEQLAEAYDFSEAITATMHEPMLVLDKDLRVRTCNTAFCKTFLVMKTDTEGRLLFELGNKQWDISDLRKLLENIGAQDKYVHNYELTHVFPDIGKKTMLLNARRIEQKVSDKQLVLLAFTDITEITRKRKAETKGLEDIISLRTSALRDSNIALAGRNIALQKMIKELETFTFISSHDLQEPLRKIRNFASTLLKEEKKNLSASGQDYLQRMSESVKRMQRLIEDLLTYSRAKDATHSLEETDLNKVIAGVVAEFDDALKEKKGIVTADGLCQLAIIPFQFRQLMQNLLSNSIKFAHGKRPLRIAISSSSGIGSSFDNDALEPNVVYCRLSVTDNGIGFDPIYKDRIFEVFQRLHEYEEYNGTGIGLAICKRIVENHQGVICATGVLGKGTQIDIYIPMEQKLKQQ